MRVIKTPPSSKWNDEVSVVLTQREIHYLTSLLTNSDVEQSPDGDCGLTYDQLDRFDRTLHSEFCAIRDRTAAWEEVS